MRSFSTCSAVRSHYQTLSVPRTANKNQIKSSFYKLSKVYHPDVAKDPTAKEKFQAVSEAYAILGDDRKRRAYDRTLVDDSHSHRHPAHGHDSPMYDTTRRRGATHAWQSPHTQHHPRYPHRAGPGAGGHYQRPHTEPGPHFRDNPFSSPNVQRATGRRATAGERERMEMDRINNISGFWRTMQVIGVIFVIAAVGGGFRADAS
ncbi:DnaJ-domain-containing protein [Cristinia sonorae]|uniref:DnaJ-domain-containing protein n=1 Tax=Cristinia sonorae TaxID=1940300 RepID=A0A8K0UDP4_9AGAR|nr:DnaJ-domain-containing protein [Cristinia sonorae]